MSVKLRIKEDPREWRKFVLVLGCFISLITYLLYRRGIVSQLFLNNLFIFAGVLVITGFLFPRSVRPIYRGAMTFSHFMGQIMGKVILTIFFYFILTPLGLLLRMTGKDLLNLKSSSNVSSYWQPAKPPAKIDQMF